MEGTKTRYSAELKMAFIHGWLYAKAQEIKEQGSFKDLTVNEVVKLIINDIK